MLIRTQPLIAEAFLLFGSMLGKGFPLSNLNFTNADTDFWEEHIYPGQDPQILWVNYRNQQKKISRLETHHLTQQIVVPLTGEIIQLVAKSKSDVSPDLASAAAFRIKMGQGICMLPGCWHATRVEKGEVQCLMITCRSTTLDLIANLKGASPLKESAFFDVDLEIFS